MPCEHAPYNVSGACFNYDWGPVHTQADNDPSEISPRGYAYRNCTDWVAWRVDNASGGAVALPENLHNAMDWPGYFPASDVSSTPAAGDIAVSTAGLYGHVAFVESVSSGAATMVVSEYNEDEKGDGDERTLPASGSEFTEFINVGVDLRAKAKS